MWFDLKSLMQDFGIALEWSLTVDQTVFVEVVVHLNFADYAILFHVQTYLLSSQSLFDVAPFLPPTEYEVYQQPTYSHSVFH